MLPDADMDVEGVLIDLDETEDELLSRREGVGWVAPRIW
jgi:hypothetical protein